MKLISLKHRPVKAFIPKFSSPTPTNWKVEKAESVGNYYHPIKNALLFNDLNFFAPNHLSIIKFLWRTLLLGTFSSGNLRLFLNDIRLTIIPPELLQNEKKRKGITWYLLDRAQLTFSSLQWTSKGPDVLKLFGKEGWKVVCGMSVKVEKVDET